MKTRARFLLLGLFASFSLGAAAKPNLVDLQARAQAGDARAQALLGANLRSQAVLPAQAAEAFRWIQSSAQQQNPLGLGLLCQEYLKGQHVQRAWQRAEELCRQAYPGVLTQAQQGEPAAIALVSLMTREGLGTERDALLSAEWLLKLFRPGVNDSTGVSSHILSYVPAAQWSSSELSSSPVNAVFLEKAQQGDAQSMLDLARSYEFELSALTPPLKEKSLQQARSWYHRAAEAGKTEAYASLARLYAKGQGGAVDRELAQQYYLKAAEVGAPDALYEAVRLFQAGVGADTLFHPLWQLFNSRSDLFNSDAIQEHLLAATLQRNLSSEFEIVAPEQLRVEHLIALNYHEKMEPALFQRALARVPFSPKTRLSLGRHLIQYAPHFVPHLKDWGWSLNQQDDAGRNLLMQAAQQKNSSLQSLLQAGADASQVDQQGHSVLMYAVRSGVWEHIPALLQAGNRWNHVNKQGENAAFVAASAGQTEFFKQPARWQQLRLDQANHRGETLLHVALRRRQLKTLAQMQKIPAVRELWNHPNQAGETPQRLLQELSQAWGHTLSAAPPSAADLLQLAKIQQWRRDYEAQAFILQSMLETFSVDHQVYPESVTELQAVAQHSERPFWKPVQNPLGQGPALLTGPLEPRRSQAGAVVYFPERDPQTQLVTGYHIQVIDHRGRWFHRAGELYQQHALE